MPAVLETRGLDKHFGGIIAANEVSLQIEKGARHALIGPNGAGKTTIVNLLTGVLKPTGGEILLDDKDITRLEPHERVRLGIARTFQINQLFADLTPIETLGLAISERLGLGKDWWRIVGSKSSVTEEIVELIERFRLGDVMREVLTGWKSTYPIVGDVRGLGPMMVIEFVRDRETKEPLAPEDTLMIVRQTVANITLPGGVALALPENSFNYNLAKFLADAAPTTDPQAFEAFWAAVLPPG